MKMRILEDCTIGSFSAYLSAEQKSPKYSVGLRARYRLFRALIAVTLLNSPCVFALDISGYSYFEHRHFFEPGLFGESKNQPSWAGQIELFKTKQNGDLSLSAKFFGRYDSLDTRKSHGDIRELTLHFVYSKYEIKAGIGKEFWGVTESQHLVDVINQTDVLESLEDEDKFGQPMVKMGYYANDSLFEVFVLPYFRERLYPGREGRLKSPLPVSETSFFESSKEQQHLDYALRYSRTFDGLFLGMHYFNGTNRQPKFLLQNDTLIPYYQQMSQLGLDTQLVAGGTLVKLEAIHRRTTGEEFSAYTGGIEYTSVGILKSTWDIGWIVEHLYDSRNADADTHIQNDLFLGLRLNVNDADGTEALFGVFQDLDNSSSYAAKLETSARLSDHWKYRVEAWMFNTNANEDPLHPIRQDDFMQIAFEYYF